MKVFFFIHHLGNGGAERVTSVLANELANRGLDITIGLYGYNKNEYDLNPNVTINIIKQPTGLSRRVKKYLNLRKYVRDLHPDIIIAVMPYNFVAMKIATLGMCIPLIVSDHANFTWNANRVLKLIRYYGYKFADRVTVLSHNDEIFMTNRLHYMKVMYNPLSFPRLFEPTQRKKNILACGRISIWNVKGFDLIIKIWGKLADKYPDWELEIAGDGCEADFECLKKITKECGIGNRTKFLGFCKNIKDVMAHSSIFVLSSRAEGFPCSLLEAMSQGCAPVSFSIHNIISEIITDGKDGYIVNDGDLQTFEEKLSLLIEQEELREIISKNAIESMKRFETTVIGNEWESFLNEVVKI